VKVPISWLREFVDVAVEPQKLGHDLTMVGLALEGLERDGADAVLDLDITTNRVDCMNVFGVAREVSVIYGLPLRAPAIDFVEAGPPAEDALDVAIEAEDLCPRFCARVLDVRLAPSPAWLRDRLEQVGVRPINNLVDLTNYVMMELGHPSHAFDLRRVPAGRLVARWGREGETLTTLDGVERRVPAAPRVGFVACPEGPLALAGIMGGGSSEVSDETRTVALEAAYWDPLSIRRAARALGMHTEASHRFERGADPEAPPRALARISHLLAKIGGGTVRPGLIDRLPQPIDRRRTRLRPARLSLVLGASVPEGRAEAILSGLGFSLAQDAGDGIPVEVPSWRGDVTREIDLIEEVGRHHGLDKIPSRLPPGQSAVGLSRAQVRERQARELLVASGFTEVINLGFLPENGPLAGPGEALRLGNPLAEDQSALRRSLVFPGLLTALRTNLRQGRRDMRLFEIGRVFLGSEGKPSEELRLGAVLAGEMRPSHWSERGRRADFFDLKGLLAPIAERLRLPVLELEREGLPPFLHPGKSAVARKDGAVVGWIGALHPDLAEALELKDETFAAELRLSPLLEAPADVARLRPIARQPAVSRDLSIVCARETEAVALLDRARAAAGPLLREVQVADRYEGPPVPEGRMSLTLALRYQDPARTLTGEEVEASVAAVTRALHEAGAEIRGE
jgi:phenylalanyl-tRNA synthetase beta chain